MDYYRKQIDRQYVVGEGLCPSSCVGWTSTASPVKSLYKRGDGSLYKRGDGSLFDKFKSLGLVYSMYSKSCQS